MNSWLQAWFLANGVGLGQKNNKSLVLGIPTEAYLKTRTVLDEKFLLWEKTALNWLFWWRNLSNFTLNFLFKKSTSVLLYTTVLQLPRSKFCNSVWNSVQFRFKNIKAFQNQTASTCDAVVLPERHNWWSLCLTSSCTLTNRIPTPLLGVMGEVINLGISLVARNTGGADTNTAALKREAEGKAI